MFQILVPVGKVFGYSFNFINDGNDEEFNNLNKENVFN